MVIIRIQEQYEMDIAFDMIDESDGGDSENDYEGDFTEISITLSDYSPTYGRNRVYQLIFIRTLTIVKPRKSCFIFGRCESPAGSIIDMNH